MTHTEIPLEELVFIEHLGGLSDQFYLDENLRLPKDLRESQMFRGFSDGYLRKPHKYETMPEWKQNIIEFFLGGDHITVYDLSYYFGQRRRNGEPLIEFREIARV